LLNQFHDSLLFDVFFNENLIESSQDDVKAVLLFKSGKEKVSLCWLESHRRVLKIRENDFHHSPSLERKNY
jgi:hypothetical protein